ncbi:MAG: response regulator [candidate division Zixibacteria bacterium]|nr:response regulator [candidate division Zixibacteria bacterium]
MQRQPSVLIVDDEKFIRQILYRIIKRVGFNNIGEAADGVEALEKFKKTTYDLVITDIKMPNKDGIELLSEIKATYPQTMVILITSYTGEYNSQNAKDTGADGYITKPFKNTEIAQTLKTLFQKQQLKKLKKKKQASNQQSKIVETGS